MLSNCLDSTAVSEIGLRSSSILRAGVTFGMGITVAHFQSAGIYPSLIESLNMAHMGGAKLMAWSLKIQFGISILKEKFDRKSNWGKYEIEVRNK